MPRAIFINKLDRERSSFEDTLADIQENLDPKAIPVQMPWGKELGFKGIIDLISLKAYAYKTDRSLYSAKLTGNYAWGQFRLRPSAEVLHYEEKQRAFLNIFGDRIGEQTVRLGRFTFGPEIAYKFVRHDASTFEPFASLKGVWDFEKTKAVNLADGTPVGGDEFRGWIEGGATFRSLSGVSVRAGAGYDGIGGDKYHAIREQVTVTVPLN